MEDLTEIYFLYILAIKKSIFLSQYIASYINKREGKLNKREKNHGTICFFDTDIL